MLSLSDLPHPMRRILRSRYALAAGSSPTPPQRATDSAGCDSLLRTTWGYALRRYLD